MERDKFSQHLRFCHKENGSFFICISKHKESFNLNLNSHFVTYSHMHGVSANQSVRNIEIYNTLSVRIYLEAMFFKAAAS